MCRVLGTVPGALGNVTEVCAISDPPSLIHNCEIQSIHKIKSLFVSLVFKVISVKPEFNYCEAISIL
jgi:hypothetical protein